MSGKHPRLHARDEHGRKLKCKRGHDMTDPKNYSLKKGYKICLWCKRIMERKFFYLNERLRRPKRASLDHGT